MLVVAVNNLIGTIDIINNRIIARSLTTNNVEAIIHSGLIRGGYLQGRITDGCVNITKKFVVIVVVVVVFIVIAIAFAIDILVVLIASFAAGDMITAHICVIHGSRSIVVALSTRSE